MNNYTLGLIISTFILLAVISFCVKTIKCYLFKVDYDSIAPSIDIKGVDNDYLEVIGKIGEKRVCAELNRVPIKKHEFFNTYLFEENDKHSTEIDAICVLTSGIYVFESKNHKGYIKGDDDIVMWGKKKKFFDDWEYNFYSPIKQNKGHINFLKRQLNIQKNDNIPIYSIIVFNDQARLRISNRTPNYYVCKYKDISKIVNKIHRKSIWNRTIVEKNSLEIIIKKLELLNKNNLKKARIHIKNVKEKCSDE